MAREKADSVRDVPSCLAWLSDIGTRDSERAVPAYIGLLKHLADKELLPQVYLDILETLSPPILATLKVAARDMEHRALPLEATEWTQLLALHELGNLLCAAYVSLVSQVSETVLPPKRGVVAPANAVAPRVLAIQRGLAVQAHTLTLLYRSRTTPGPLDWEEGCRLAEAARDLKCLDIPVPDLLASTKVDTCREAFVAPLLIRLAQPHTLTASEFGAVRLCARSWASKVGFRVDLGGIPFGDSPGPSVILSPNYSVRLDTQRLLQSVHRRVQALAEGKTPQDLGFDNKLSAPACRFILQRLSTVWSKAGDTHAPPESKSAESAYAFLGMPTHAAAADTGPKAFGVGDGPYQYAQRRSDTVTFVTTEEDAMGPKVEQLFNNAERWEVMAHNEKEGVFRRLHRQPHVNLGGLISLRLGEKPQSAAFQLGYVTSLRLCGLEETQTYGSLHELGIQWLSGIPEPIEMELNVLKTAEAFYLKPKPGATHVPSLILPLATFKEPTTIKVLIARKARRVRLASLLMRGLDFDQVSFSFADDHSDYE